MEFLDNYNNDAQSTLIECVLLKLAFRSKLQLRLETNVS